MYDLYSLNFREILHRASSDEPIPGGGSISAMCAGLAASMTAMAASVTVSGKRRKDYRIKAQTILDGALTCMNGTERLAKLDMQAFQSVMDAYKVQDPHREDAIHKALIEATSTPLEIAKVCVKILEHASELAPICNKSVVSDVGVAVYLSEAALRSALLTVNTNLPLLKEGHFKDSVMHERKAIPEKAESLKNRSLKMVNSRIES